MEVETVASSGMDESVGTDAEENESGVLVPLEVAPKQSKIKRKKKAKSDSERHERLLAMKLCAPKTGKSYFQVIGFTNKVKGQKKTPFSLCFLNKDGEPHWQHKSELMEVIVENMSTDGSRVKCLRGLKFCKIRDVPFEGDGLPKKTERGYDIHCLYGFIDVGPLSGGVSMEDRLKSIGEIFKKMFQDAEFKFHDDKLLEDNCPRVHECLKKKGELYKHIAAANIRVEERSSLDAHFLDETIPDIMEKMFPGVSCNDYTEAMIKLCSRSGELPLSFDD